MRSMHRMAGMAGLEQHVALVPARARQEAKERPLRRLQRRHEVVAAVQHQDRHRHAGGEVEGIHLGQGFREIQTPALQDWRLESALDGQERRRQESPRADPVERESLAVDVGPGLEVVDGAGEVLGGLDQDVSLLLGPHPVSGTWRSYVPL